MSTPSAGISARPHAGLEIWLVLGLSLGQAGVYAAVQLIQELHQGNLESQTSTLNASQSPQEYLDLTYQLLGIGFALVPVGLALYLLTAGGDSVRLVLGLDRSNRWRDVLWGAGIAAAIGVPGLGIYLLGRALGLTTTVIPDALNGYWWTVPVLIASAIQNAVLEEVVVVGFVITRLRQLGWSTRAVIVTSALVRGSYHLYQGVGPGIANAVMGVIFGTWYQRTGRVGPLIVAHSIIDTVAFVGYGFAKRYLGLP